MLKKQREVMVYLMTGFLDSGKTQFLKETLEEDYFQIKGTTLILLCEDGEEEYDEKLCKKHRVVVEPVENQEDLTKEWMEEMDAKHEPERVIVEYNGMWPVSEFERTPLPSGWEMVQKLTTVDASTFQVYQANMKSLFVEMVKDSELVVFNRCEDIEPLAGYRRSVKVVNPGSEVVFEDENGEIDNIFADDVPYDMDTPVVEIRPEDYGIWYVDVSDHPDRYENKTVEFTARVIKPKGFPKDQFMPGRDAMTCCAQDIQPLGYVCEAPQAEDLKAGDWIRLQAQIEFKYSPAYKGEGPILEAKEIEQTDPIEDLVYFN